MFYFHLLCHISDDGYYNLQKNSGASSGGDRSSGGVGGKNIVNSEGYSYVDEVPSLQTTQHRQQQPKSTSSSHRDQQAQNRARRAQRRVTHNEKRYHSGESNQIDFF